MPDTNTWGSDYYAFHGIPYNTDGEPLPQGREGEQRAYTASSWVYRCIDVLSTYAVSVPMRAYEPAKAAGRQPQQIEHDALALIKTCNPIDYVAGDDLTKMSLTSLELHGESYLQFETGSRGVPLEIWWRPVQNVEPILDARRGYGGFKLTIEQGKPVLIQPEQMAMMRYPNPMQPLRGIGRIAAARTGVNLQMFGEASNLALQRNGMRPSMVFTSNAPMSTDKQSIWSKAFQSWLGGPAKRGRALVLGDDLKPVNVALSPVDAEWVNSMRLARIVICGLFGVPPMIAGDDERATYSNYGEARKIVWQERVIPWLDWYGAQLTRKVMYRVDPKAAAKGLYIGFDYTEIEGLGEDTALLWDRVLKGMDQVLLQVERQIVTPDEARPLLGELASMVGLDASAYKGDVPGGRTFHVPYTAIPVEETGTQTVIDIMAARGQNPQLEENIPGAPHVGDDAQAPDPDKTPPSGGSAPARPAPRRSPSDQADASSAGGTSASGGKSGPGNPAPPPRGLKAAKPAPAAVRAARLAKPQSSLEKGLKRHFQALQRESLRTLKDANGAKADNSASVPDNLYDRQLSKEELAKLVKQGVIDAATAAYLGSREDFGLDVNFSDENPWLDQYMGRRLQLIHGIDDTTHDRLRESLLEGAQAGESIPQLSDRISQEFREAIDGRATTIARTETINAYGMASLASYRDAGLEQAQMFDGHYDEECAAVDGQVVTLDEAEQLMADEHPNGLRGVSPMVDLGE